MSDFEDEIVELKRENTEYVKLFILRDAKIYDYVKNMSDKELQKYCISYAAEHDDAFGEVFTWELEDDQAVDWNQVKEGL